MSVGVTTHCVTGLLACWAVRQSPYPAPDNLGLVIARFEELWPKETNFGDFSMQDWDNYEALYDAIWATFEQIPELVAWNSPKSGHGAEMVFTSRYGGPSPDDDIIDLYALCRNVARAAWKESEEEQAGCI